MYGHDALKDVNVSLTCVILCAAEAIILAFQHFIVMLGTTVIIPSALVPQMGGGNVSPETYVLNLLAWHLYFDINQVASVR